MKRKANRTVAVKSRKLPNNRPKTRAKRQASEAAWGDDRVTIEQLREMMRQFVAQRAWEKYHLPRNLEAGVAVEAGELLELFQWLSPDEVQRRRAVAGGDEAFRRAVGEELADVLMYLMSLANAMELDVGKTVLAKMAKNRLKYPADQFYGRYERPVE